MWLLLVACAARHAERNADPLAAPLGEADRAWSLRAEPGGLARALAAYEALLAVAPGDPRVLARIARTHHRIGLLATDPAVALTEFETAREVASVCLATDPEVAAVLPGAGWRWTAELVAVVPASRAPCLVWAASGAVGTVDVRGPGAALELEVATLLADRAVALTPTDPWALRAAARVHLLDPEADDAARADARTLLAQAADQAPGLLLLRWELALARGDTAPTPPAPSASDPFLLENTWFRERLAAPR